VDNASTEKNPADFVKLFPDIKLIENKVNAGFAKGNNCGLQKANGEYVLLLNSDTELINNAIFICLQSIRKNTRIAAMGCRLMFPDGTVQHNCQRFPSLRHKLFELLRLQKFLPLKLGGKMLLGYFFDHKTVIYPDWIWGTFFLFKKNLLKLLPGNKLADDFFMYGEDMQWCMDFRRRGYKIAFEPRAQVVHHMGQSNGNRLQLLEQHSDLFMKRYYSRWKIFLIKKLDRWLL
jgi:GT2 family glycosyltransferase